MFKRFILLSILLAFVASPCLASAPELADSLNPWRWLSAMWDQVEEIADDVSDAFVAITLGDEDEYGGGILPDGASGNENDYGGGIIVDGIASPSNEDEYGGMIIPNGLTAASNVDEYGGAIIPSG